MQLLPGVHSHRHLHKYVLTGIWTDKDTHTAAAAAERHIFRITKRDVEEKVKEQREKRDRDEKNLDVSEGEFNITKEQR